MRSFLFIVNNRRIGYSDCLFTLSKFLKVHSFLLRYFWWSPIWSSVMSYPIVQRSWRLCKTVRKMRPIYDKKNQRLERHYTLRSVVSWTNWLRIKTLKLNVVFNGVLLSFWGYSQSCCYFRPSFENYCLSNLLAGSLYPPLPPSQNQSTVQYIQTVCDWKGWGGVKLCWGPHSQEF
jgi:hypothetical protein